jgi:hypothetical protein
VVEPDADQGCDCDQRQKAIDEDQQHRVDAHGIGHRRRGSGIEMSPDGRAETKDAEQHQHAAGRYDQSLRHNARQQRLGADAARHLGEACAHPGGIGPFGSE